MRHNTRGVKYCKPCARVAIDEQNKASYRKGVQRKKLEQECQELVEFCKT